jgi:hypothetical protein
MEQRKIKIVIDAMGNPKIEAENFNGIGCEEATKGIEQALAAGNGSYDRVLKPEWYNQGTTDTNEQEHVQW